MVFSGHYFIHAGTSGPVTVPHRLINRRVKKTKRGRDKERKSQKDKESKRLREEGTKEKKEKGAKTKTVQW